MVYNKNGKNRTAEQARCSMKQRAILVMRRRLPDQSLSLASGNQSKVLRKQQENTTHWQQDVRAMKLPTRALCAESDNGHTGTIHRGAHGSLTKRKQLGGKR